MERLRARAISSSSQPRLLGLPLLLSLEGSTTTGDDGGDIRRGEGGGTCRGDIHVRGGEHEEGGGNGGKGRCKEGGVVDMRGL